MPIRPEDSLAGMIAGLKEKTGRTLEEWSALIREKGHEKHGQIMAFLKGEHGVSHGYANQIALNHLKSGASGDTDPIEAMFAGGKAAVRPIYDLLIAKIQAFGPDVDLAPKKGYMSVRRSKQFAVLQPAASRLDVGINLKGVESSGKLEASGSFNSMLSHRVKVASVEEVDPALLGWLKQAYDAA